MIDAKRNGKTNGAYATTSDFCHIFSEDMSGLYGLALLLTADHGTAEQCFVSGLGDCAGNRQVFREWAESWARRTIIRNAVRMAAPQPFDAGEAGGAKSGIALGVRAEIAAVLGLRTFERFVFVMSVLEHYSDHECSVLLGCARGDVSAARTRALRQIGSLIEVSGQIQTGGPKDRQEYATRLSLDNLNVSPLARSA